MDRENGASQGDLFHFERIAAAKGYTRIAGVDEVGRGPLAGPVVAAAVILPESAHALPLADSKALPRGKREELAAQLRELGGVQIGIGVVSPAEIDRLNILRAAQAAMRLAVSQLDPLPDYALVDGLPVPEFPVPARFVVKGDARSATVAAASIIAKVHRDRLMVELDDQHPGYGFARHKGYATAIHLEALRRLGPSPQHRRTFRPVAEAGGETVRPSQLEFAFGTRRPTV
jgi:ribonuclease HII